MAETSSSSSRSRVTITLGRTGQVVKRAGAPLLDTDPPPSQPPAVTGTKRSVRDRLGAANDNNKRSASFYFYHLYTTL
ncbi:hypothetical protein CTI12_AA518780 [Artemisia annua]|uniref:Uncharacterized protein n=1 Tax=Artemisia annua TaxID=35608 RepID=A0A2U1L8G8_ARTAN|nr:hypothetical protein CTI12_AA518780 [Artemisia annua]